MRHVMWRAYYDYEKEEDFLNEMSAKGLALVDYTWCRYVFEDAPKGEYIYRLELLENPVNHPESQKYIRFMEDAGATFVTSYLRWVYFRKKASDGEFDIYSDIESRIKHYKRIRTLFLAVALMNFFPGISNFSAGLPALISGKSSVNFYMSLVSLSIAALFAVGLVLPLCRKIGALTKESQIRG